MGNNVIIKCQQCGRVINRMTSEAKEWKKLSLMNRGKQSAYICPFCAESIMSYYEKNSTIYGTPKVNTDTLSIELESMKDTFQARVELFAHNYIATRDCTVQIEFKSPIYNGFNALSKYCESIEKLNKMGYIDTISDECGCHIHIGTFENWEKMELQNYWKKLFEKCENYMRFDCEKTLAFFGRYFQEEYACEIENSRYDWISCNSSAPTIELRLSKFISASQFQKCVRYARDVKKICKAFLLDNDKEKNVNKYAKRLQKLTMKYYESI